MFVVLDFESSVEYNKNNVVYIYVLYKYFILKNIFFFYSKCTKKFHVGSQYKLATNYIFYIIFICVYYSFKSLNCNR